MKKSFLVFSIVVFLFTGQLFANSASQPSFQMPITLLNSTKSIVTFHIKDDQFHVFNISKLPIAMLPTILMERVQPMWHHNISVYATIHHFWKSSQTVRCEPFPEYSYDQKYLFVAMMKGGRFECNFVLV